MIADSLTAGTGAGFAPSPMGIEPASGEVEFLRHQRETVRGDKAQYGIAERWCAPTVSYDCPSGFGEETWLDCQTETIIAWCEGPARVTREWGIERGTEVSGPGRLTVQPQGLPNRFLCRHPVHFSQLVLLPSLLAYVATRLATRPLSRFALRDDLASLADADLLRHVREYAARAKSKPTRLEMEARAILIAEHLLVRHHGIRVAEAAPFVDWRLRRAIEYLEARLAEPVGLAELAMAVGLTTQHLTSLFRTGTGEPPHRWLMRRRVERACEMLTDPKRSVTAIAFACGFASSQHMATAFRRQLGIKPSAYRRGRLS